MSCILSAELIVHFDVYHWLHPHLLCIDKYNSPKRWYVLNTCRWYMYLCRFMKSSLSFVLSYHLLICIYDCTHDQVLTSLVLISEKSPDLCKFSCSFEAPEFWVFLTSCMYHVPTTFEEAISSLSCTWKGRPKLRFDRLSVSAKHAEGILIHWLIPSKWSLLHDPIIWPYGKFLLPE